MIGQFKHLAVLALLGIGAYAKAKDGQHSYIEYDVTPRLRYGNLKPSTMDASAQLKTQTMAELAVVHISVEKEAVVEKAALTLARDRRDEVENLIQLLSQNSSEISQRYEWSDAKRGGFRKGMSYRRISSKDESDPDSVTATANLLVKFEDLDALQRFVATIDDTEDVVVNRVEWKLTPETQKKVISELRRDALKELNAVGADYEHAFGVVMKTMEDYKECNRDPFMYDEEEERSKMYDWNTIRKFFTASDDELKVGKVSTSLDVSCRFVAGKMSSPKGEVMW